eukprot:scaffold66_cov299-Pavlova_lutheri.AAC.3
MPGSACKRQDVTWASLLLQEHEYGRDLDPLLQESRRHAAASAVWRSVASCSGLCLFPLWFVSILQGQEQHSSFRFHDIGNDIRIRLSHFRFDGHHGTPVPHSINGGCTAFLVAHLPGQWSRSRLARPRVVPPWHGLQGKQISFEDSDVSAGVHTFDPSIFHPFDVPWQSVLLEKLVDSERRNLHAKDVAPLHGQPGHVLGFSTEWHEHPRMIPVVGFFPSFSSSQQVV